VDRADELGQIASGFNTFLNKLQNMIRDVVTSVQKVSDSSEHTADIAIRTNQGVQRQMAEIDQVATAVHEMTATAQDVARNATQAAEAASHADRSANDGKRIVEGTAKAISALAGEIGRAVSVVQTLAKDSENINAILVAIRGIAEQTNLLALNAAIEAARAGEQGRGFAVVADEVRSLSQRTQESTREISATVEALQRVVLQSVELMQTACSQAEVDAGSVTELGDHLGEIAGAVQRVSDMIAQIATAVEQQAATAEEVSGNIQQVDQAAADLLHGAQAVHGVADRLSDGSRALAQNTAHFHLD
jgi:methyl-accepting chemotaxis protein